MGAYIAALSIVKERDVRRDAFQVGPSYSTQYGARGARFVSASQTVRRNEGSYSLFESPNS